MYIEDFRDNDYKKYALILGTTPPLKIYYNIDEFCTNAYDFTLKSLQQLENSNDVINNSAYCYPAISMWHLSLQSFLQLLDKLFASKTGNAPMASSSLTGCYKNLLANIGMDINENKSILMELEDAERFWTGLFLNLTDVEKIGYKQASFSTLTSLINQADVLQYLLIATSIFEKFRYIIAGLDFMPNITIVANGKIIAEKLNVLRDKILIPSFKDILSKFILDTKLIIAKDHSSYPTSKIFEEKQVLKIYKYQVDEKYKNSKPVINTNIIGQFYAQYMKKFENK